MHHRGAVNRLRWCFKPTIQRQTQADPDHERQAGQRVQRPPVFLTKDVQQFLRAMPGRRDRIGAGPLDIVDRTPGFLDCTAVLVAKRSCRAPELCCDIVQLDGDSRKAASCFRNRRLLELLSQSSLIAAAITSGLMPVAILSGSCSSL